MNPSVPLRAELEASRLSWLRGRGLLRFGYLTEPSARFAWKSTPLALVYLGAAVAAFAPPLLGEGLILVENLYRSPHCPLGMSEWLLKALLSHFERPLRLGLTPTPEILGAGLSSLARALYPFDSLAFFRNWLQPTQKKAYYLNTPKSLSRLQLGILLSRLFTQDSVWLFRRRTGASEPKARSHETQM